MSGPVNEPHHLPVPDDELIARLLRQAEQTSSIHREMAEAKSLRQESNTEGRTDLYMWPTPEQTTEGKAAARLTAMREEIERKDEVLRPFAHYCELNDLLDSGDPERAIEVPVSDLQRAYAALTTDHKGTAP